MCSSDLQSELKSLQREVGITFLFVTHDQEEAMTMSDRIAVMNHGRIEQIGTPQDVYDRPANLFVADFIGSSNILYGKLLHSAGGIATVQLDAGIIAQSSHTHHLSAGQRVAITVRPDDMHLLAETEHHGHGNSLTGQIAKVSFLGTHRQIVITTGDAIEVMIRQPPTAATGALTPDARALVGWPPERSTCFPVDQP